ncbi:hypothetical protein BDN67DRAFT_578285 [Paxillus ammoniavirescens]|nr:hypothetical protein BDN67DRAFT_578285 [Paxillus ammoniavirescens]
MRSYRGFPCLSGEPFPQVALSGERGSLLWQAIVILRNEGRTSGRIPERTSRVRYPSPDGHRLESMELKLCKLLSVGYLLFCGVTLLMLWETPFLDDDDR